ncbi:unnamed protein product [Linum trigynum]|uniref:FAR1 domain-containing protein n=1 Tax=Linum trigynum TaxID=586398 RepID=A0AAV2FAA1_9ROSI
MIMEDDEIVEVENNEDINNSNGSTIHNVHQSSEVEDDDLADLLLLQQEDIEKLRFANTEEAYDFWRNYGLVTGFDVRKEDIGRDKDKVMIWRRFVCSGQGTKRDRKGERKREPKGETRFDCKARIRVRLDKSDGKWFVDIFHNVHSHVTVPKKYRHYMKGNRQLSDAVKAAINFRRAAGMKTSQIVSLAVAEAGGYSKMGFTRKDAYNYVDKDRKEQISDGDAAAALAYLHAKLSADEQFVIELKKDDEDRLVNLFWADSISVADYACFGELLAFDATY